MSYCPPQEVQPKRIHPYFHRLPIYNDGIKSVNILGDGTVAVAHHGCSCGGIQATRPSTLQVPKSCGRMNCGYPDPCLYSY